MSLYQFKHNKKVNYTVVDNAFINDGKLTWKSKGILLYLFSRPENWQVYVADLINKAADGEKALRSGLQELETFGYLARFIQRDEKGRFEKTVYEVYENPIDNPVYQNGKMDNKKIEEIPHTQKRQVVSRDVEKRCAEKEVLLNTNKQTTDLNKEEKEEKLPQNFENFLAWLFEKRKHHIKDRFFWEKKLKQSYLSKNATTIENYDSFKLENSKDGEKQLLNDLFKESLSRSIAYNGFSLEIQRIVHTKELHEIEDKSNEYAIYALQDGIQKIFVLKDMDSLKTFLHR